MVRTHGPALGGAARGGTTEVIFPKLSVAAVNTVAVRVMPFTVSSPLYPLTLYFQGGPSEEYMHFETALAQAARSVASQ